MKDKPLTTLNSSLTELDDKEMLSRYQRAQRMMQGLLDADASVVLNDKVIPSWIEDSHCFWYKRRLKNGVEYRLVDAEQVSNSLAFDHDSLAQSLASATNKKIDPNNLPLGKLTITLQPRSFSFNAFGEDWEYDELSGCIPKTVTADPPGLVSPNGQYTALVRDNNIWLRDFSNGDEYPLT